jgi:hypothetical protein
MNYDEYLKGKSIALVGPAPTVLEVDNNIDIINSCDVIVRLNRALPIHKDLVGKVGSRTNVLYNCLDEDPESGGYLHIPYLAQEVDWVIGAYPSKPPFRQNINKFQSRNSGRVNFTAFDLDYYEHLEESMGTRPNTGILTMLDLLTRDIKSLYITGFTFFKGGYVKQYRNYTEEQVLHRMKIHGNHHQEPQFRYVKDLLLNDDRVKVDNFMLEILQGDKL